MDSTPVDLHCWHALSKGKRLHSLVNRIRIKFDLSTYKFIHNIIFHMYVIYKSLAGVYDVFDSMNAPDIFSWISLRIIINIVHQMQKPTTEIQPHQFTFSIILKTCTKLGDSQIVIIHTSKALEKQILSYVVVVSALVDMYAKYG